jgi:predicted amidohydrolase YtcJ
VEYVKVNGGADPTSHVFWGGLKEFADGSLGSSTALFHQPYEVEQPPTSGIRNIPTAELESMVEQADLACMQVAIHAIGDLAVDEASPMSSKP